LRTILKTPLILPDHSRSASARPPWNETEVTRTNRTRGIILISLLAVAVVLTGSSIIISAVAQDQGSTFGPQPPPRDPPWMSQLTDEQKAEIEQLMQSMRDSGATQEEIREAVDAKLQEWGIPLPADNGGHHEPPWMSQLTGEQKTEIQQLTESMKDSGATPQEIRDAVCAKLQEWGIQPPEDNGGRHELPWMSKLTDEQKTEIQQLMQSMRDSGATQEEIRDAVSAKLQEWGIELPPPPQIPGQ